MEGAFFDDHERKIDAWAQQQMHQYGWYAHFVPEDSDFPNSINYHTHGIKESFDHADLQICFPLPPETAHQIFSITVSKIKGGMKFIPGVKYPEIIGNDLSVEFIAAKECGRQVIRIIFPDKNGTYEGEIFRAQFETSEI